MDEIGARLREARMHLRIDINEVEVRTKIRAKYLRAMENEEWDLLPGDVYVRSFLRTYGDFLGLDSRELVDDYRRRYESPADHEPPPITPPSARDRRERDRPRRRAGVPSWAIVGAVLVIVAVVLYFVGINNGGNSDRQASTPARTSAIGHHHHRRSHPRTTTHRSSPPHPTSVTLSLVPTGAVYVCLVNGRGRALIPGRIYDTGETIPTETGHTLLLTLGNASVSVKANGVNVPVSASSSAIGLRFTPGGHAPLPPGREPTCSS
jgi:cytoskeleton protein RodZ